MPLLEGESIGQCLFRLKEERQTLAALKAEAEKELRNLQVRILGGGVDGSDFNLWVLISASR